MKFRVLDDVTYEEAPGVTKTAHLGEIIELDENAKDAAVLMQRGAIVAEPGSGVHHPR